VKALPHGRQQPDQVRSCVSGLPQLLHRLSFCDKLPGPPELLSSAQLVKLLVEISGKVGLGFNEGAGALVEQQGQGQGDE